MKVLFVGNGFDRKIGLKTDYISFLDWMKKNGYGVGSNFNKQSEKIYLKNDNVKSRLKKYIRLKKQGINFEFSGEIFDPKKEVYGDVESAIKNKLLYLLPTLVNDFSDKHKKNPNIWYCFLQLLRIEKLNKFFNLNLSKFENYINDDGSWVDVEGIIQLSIRNRIDHNLKIKDLLSISQIFDIVSFTNFLFIDIIDPKEIYNKLWKDFEEFKETLCKYLKEIGTEDYEGEFNNQSELVKPTAKLITLNSIRFDLIISFNYTNFLSNNLNIYHVHGSVLDKSQIVFGFDTNLKGGVFIKDERKTEFEQKLSKNKQLLRFSKIAQLLNLQADKESIIMEKIEELSILGHSIGEQDYSYYFSILDRNVDAIIINCLWYEFNEGGNNKEFMKEALFEMLTHYERYSNMRVLHKMIFEGRIKLKEIHIPKIF